MGEGALTVTVSNDAHCALRELRLSLDDADKLSLLSCLGLLVIANILVVLWSQRILFAERGSAGK